LHELIKSYNIERKNEFLGIKKMQTP